MNYLDLIQAEGKRRNLSKPLGPLTLGNLIGKFGRTYDNPKLKVELKKCTNFIQMINVIEQLTGELSKERTKEQLHKFQDRIDRIVKFARL